MSGSFILTFLLFWLIKFDKQGIYRGSYPRLVSCIQCLYMWYSYDWI